MRLQLAAAAVLVLAAFVGLAPPASAHGGGDEGLPPASNYRSTITSIEPDVDGLHWRLIDAGTRIEVVNETGDVLTVFGDQGEPYLRIGPDGVEENQLSVTAFLQANPGDDVVVPQRVLSGGEPEWREVSSSPSWAWHDDRAHWTDADPVAVTSADRVADEVVVVPSWSIEGEWSGRPLVVTGRVAWVEGPTPWPSLLGMVAIAAALLGLTLLGRPGTALAVGAALAVAASFGRFVGTWSASAAPALAKVEGFVMPALAWLLLAIALAKFRASHRDSVLLATGACVGIGVLLGATGWTWLTRSQLPTGLDPAIARATVVAAAGAALGMLAVAALAWVRPGTLREEASVRPAG